MAAIRLLFLKLQRDVRVLIWGLACLIWVLSALIMAVLPILQQIWSWLKHGAWLSRDLYWLTGISKNDRLSSWEGVNQILTWAMSMHSAIAWLAVLTPLFLMLTVWSLAIADKEDRGLEGKIEELEQQQQKEDAFKAPTPQESPEGIPSSSLILRYFGIMSKGAGFVWTVFAVILVWGFLALLVLTFIAVALDY